MKLLLKLLKIIFIISVVTGTIFGAFWMIYIKNWPYWTGVSLFLIVISLAVGWHILKKILLRRREQQYVKQVIEQYKPLEEVTDNKSEQQILSLERQWADSLDILKQSHLKKQGDPLYLLPWYLVLGATGCGKTSALRSARLSSPFPEAPRPAGSGTRFCDWWYTEHAIILDTAGKYSNPLMEPAERDEWQRLLSLLLAARKKEPLNGLVVAVAADQLLKSDRDSLGEEGRAIRLRIDEMMQVMGAKIPVYLLITKCDQVYGIDQLARNLPESFFKQPMGVVNDDLEKPISDFIDFTLDRISERLKDLRFMLLDKAQGDKTGLMLLAEEIRTLQPGLESFMLGVFRANPYQESPIMRGIFFSSAQQSGTPVSRYLQRLDYAGDSPPPGGGNDILLASSGTAAVPSIRNAATDITFMNILPGTSQGLFLFDFFDWVLTSDRWLFRPLKSEVRRFRFSWGTGMISWMTLLVGLLGLVSTSYMLNKHVISEYNAEFKQPTYLTENLLDDIIILDRFRTVILKMEERNKGWWVPRFGLDQSEQLVIKLKKDYCALLRKYIFSGMNRKLDEGAAGITSETPGGERGAYVANIVSRLQFMNARLEGKDLEFMKTLPPPSGAFLMLIDSNITPEVAKQYQECYLYYSAWQEDNTPIVVAKQKLTMLLGKILVGPKGNYDFNWTLNWINSTEIDKRITLRDFWDGSEETEYEYIEPCFTLEGKKKLDYFLTQISRVADSSSTLDERIKRFMNDYEKQYISAWEEFATAFTRGENAFKSSRDMLNQAANIGIGKIPAELFIERMVKELEPFSRNANTPQWLKLAIAHDKIHRQAHETEFLKQASGLSKMTGGVLESGKQLLNEIKSKKVELPDRSKPQKQLDLVKAYAEFSKSLQDMARGITTNGAAMRLATEIFSGGGAPQAAQAGDSAGTAKPSPFSRVQETYKSFQAQMRDVGDDKIYWDLINSSLRFFAMTAAREAECSLQEKWQSQVLAETSAASESSLQDLLFGPQGTVWSFVKGTASPFLKGGAQGYTSTSVMGQQVRFRQDFIEFITKGNVGRQKIKDSYTVRIKAYPVHVNREAKPKPQAAYLSLACGDDLQSLNNMNFQAQKSFKWGVKNCGDTILRIKFGSVTLERNYSGARGFINFLTDFKRGERTFTPEDFPEHENDLKAMSVQQIRIKYLFEGERDLLNLPDYAPHAAPPVISSCQQRGHNDNP